MPRRTVRSALLFVPVLASVALLPAACSGGAEEQLITSFFRAARLRDNMTLANIAAVTFSPTTEGIVENFTVREFGPEARRTVDLRALSAALSDAQNEEVALTRDRQAFEKTNYDTLVRLNDVMRDAAAVQRLRGRDAEVYAELETWRGRNSELQRRLSEARTRFNDDRARAENSLARPGSTPEDVSDMEIELVTKTVTIDATVTSPDGETGPRTIVFTLQRAIGTRDGTTREGRWVITGLE